MEREYAPSRRVNSDRALFIQRTYATLAGAILAFIGLEAILVNTVSMNQVIALMGGGSGVGFLVVLAAFMGASWLAQMWARSETSIGMQYAGLALYVVAEALIMLPLLYIAVHFINDKTLIPTAGILTLAVFGGLSLAAFTTGKDFSMLGPVLSVGSMVALGVIIAGCIFGFSLGLFFSFAMVALLSGFILFETSQVMYHHRTDQHVAAALMLFSSIATLFWYILRILIILNSRD
jgi:FtsH-binding integral membrane protein